MLCGTNAAMLIRFGAARSASRYSGNVEKLQSMPSAQRVTVHAFDEPQGLDDEIPVLGPSRCDAEPTVPLNHGGHTVPRRGRQIRIPQHLGVEMRMDVDEPRSQHEATEIHLVHALEIVANRRDAVVHDQHVGTTSRFPRAIHDRRTPQHSLHDSLLTSLEKALTATGRTSRMSG